MSFFLVALALFILVVLAGVFFTIGAGAFVFFLAVTASIADDLRRGYYHQEEY